MSAADRTTHAIEADRSKIATFFLRIFPSSLRNVSTQHFYFTIFAIHQGRWALLRVKEEEKEKLGSAASPG
jgi:hypothetical protein